MAENITLRKSRNDFSSFLHVFLKISLAVISIILTVISASPIIGILLVFMSKWRIFAIHPRFWLVNLKANLLDLIVAASFILITYSIHQNIESSEIAFIDILISALYAIWLTIIKLKTTDNWVLAQTLICIFLGTTANMLFISTLTSIDTSITSIFMVIIEALIGYAASRHSFIQNSQHDTPTITFICSLLVSEVIWLCSKWNIIYTISSLNIIVPQASIIITMLAFSFASVIRSINKNDSKIKLKEILPPTIFSLITVIIIIIMFSNPIFNI